MSPMATEVSPEVTSVLTLRSGSSVASRCHSRPAHVSDRGGEAVVKATGCGWGRWVGGAVDPGRAGAGLAVAEGLAAATPIGLEAAGRPASPHGLARANAIPTTTRTTAIPTSLCDAARGRTVRRRTSRRQPSALGTGLGRIPAIDHRLSASVARPHNLGKSPFPRLPLCRRCRRVLAPDRLWSGSPRLPRCPSWRRSHSALAGTCWLRSSSCTSSCWSGRWCGSSTCQNVGEAALLPRPIKRLPE